MFRRPYGMPMFHRTKKSEMPPEIFEPMHTKEPEITQELFEQMHTIQPQINQELIASCANTLLGWMRQRHLTLGTAESLTAGMIASTIASIGGASTVLRGGVVSYQSDLKHSLLGVESRYTDAENVVNEPTARQMVLGALEVLDCDIAISATGYAGPTGGDAENPVGTVFVGTGTQDRVIVRKYFYGNTDRNTLRMQVVYDALMQTIELAKRLQSEKPYGPARGPKYRSEHKQQAAEAEAMRKQAPVPQSKPIWPPAYIKRVQTPDGKTVQTWKTPAGDVFERRNKSDGITELKWIKETGGILTLWETPEEGSKLRWLSHSNGEVLNEWTNFPMFFESPKGAAPNADAPTKAKNVPADGAAAEDGTAEKAGDTSNG